MILASSGRETAWEADLVRGELWEILPPAGTHGGLGGYMSPSGTITLKTTIYSRRTILHRVMSAVGFSTNCLQGRFLAHRSVQRGEWEFVDDAEWDCSGAVVGAWDLGEDYTWRRPGVQETPDPGRAGWGTGSRGRGEFLLVPGGGWQPRRVGPDGISEASFGDVRVEFWPAPVLPEWPVPAADEPSHEW